MSNTGPRQRKREPVTFIPAPANAPEGKPDTPEGDAPKAKEGGIAKFWREQARPFLVMVFILFCMRSSLADWNVVPTGSMKPSIIEGDRIFVNKLAYDFKVPFTHIALAKWTEPKRGEVVVFDSEADGVRLVKRLMGVPGDVIEIRDNVLSINGEKAQLGELSTDIVNQVQPNNRAQYTYFTETVAGVSHPVRFLSLRPGQLTPQLARARNFGPVTVPAGCYFMLGDNRDESRDSRFDSRPKAEADNGLIHDSQNLGPGFVKRDRIVGRSSAVVLSLDYDDYYLPRSSRFFRGLP
jgi:signal peptidase I